MRVIYVQEQVYSHEPSIFLAGPTPRSSNVKSWRIEALSILKYIGFDGSVFVPESDGGVFPSVKYTDQIDWEQNAIYDCTLPVFWIPRSNDLPGFTTNVEFGMMIHRNETILYGRPNNTPHTRYLDYIYNQCGFVDPIYTDLISLLLRAKETLD